MDVIESNFSPRDVERGIESLNGFTVGGGIGEMDLSVAMRIGKGAGGLDEEIGLAEDQIVVSRDSPELNDIGIVKVGAQGENAVAREMAVLECGGSIEFRRRVATAQRGVVKGDALEGKLNSRGKRIPLRFEAACVGCGGQGDVEI